MQNTQTAKLHYSHISPQTYTSSSVIYGIRKSKRNCYCPPPEAMQHVHKLSLKKEKKNDFTTCSYTEITFCAKRYHKTEDIYMLFRVTLTLETGENGILLSGQSRVTPFTEL